MNDLNNDQVLREVQKLAISMAILDERLKNHLEKYDEVQKELKVQEIKLEEVTHLVMRHSLFFRASAWIISIFASTLGVKSFFHS